MNTQAIFHQSNTAYSFALDEHHYVVRLRTGAQDFDAVTLIYSENKHTWQTTQRACMMDKRFSDSEFDWYEVVLSLTDTRLAYVFKLKKDGEDYWFSEEGFSNSLDLEKGYYFFFQHPFIHGSDVHHVPAWTRGATVYQIFPERFARGDYDKDDAYINAPWGQKPTPKSFMGGDLRGIAQHLDHLTQMGIACLYMTPVFSSISNHKYDIKDYYAVDAAFGGDDALKALVDAAHEKGLRVVLDGVFNHASDKWPIFVEAKADKHSPYRDWFFFDENGGYQTFANVDYMPKLNTDNPQVIDYFVNCALYWMRSFHIDGWRLDVADEISPRFMRAFSDAVKRENKDAILWAEYWHEAQKFLLGDMYDGVMNYALTKALLDFFAFDTIDAQGFADRLIRAQMRYTAPAARMMLNLIDCHDTERFLTFVKGDAQKLRAAYAVLNMLDGMPMVYYGDEIGMMGGYDPDCRRAFNWDKDAWNKELYAFYQEQIALKKMPVMQGRLSIWAQGDKVFLQREIVGETVTLTVDKHGVVRE